MRFHIHRWKTWGVVWRGHYVTVKKCQKCPEYREISQVDYPTPYCPLEVINGKLKIIDG